MDVTTIIKGLFWGFFVCLAFVRCSPHAPSASYVSFQVRPSISSLLSGNLDSSPDYPFVATGGMMVYGAGPGGRFGMSLNALTENRVLKLNTGTWRFFAIVWDGATPLKGDVHCGTVEMKLEGGVKNVQLQVSRAGCTSGEFSTNANQLNGPSQQFAGVQLFSCNDLYAISNASATCHSTFYKIGENRSYRVVLKEFNAGRGNLETFASSCYSRDSLTNSSVLLSGINIPFNTPYPDLFKMELKAYKDTACSTLVSRYEFSNGWLSTSKVFNGIVSGAASDSLGYPLSSGSANYYNVYLADTMTGSGYTALPTLLPMPIYCSGNHCVPMGSTASYNSAGNLKKAKQQYYEYMGTPDGTNPFGGNGGRLDMGLLGSVRSDLGPAGIGGILYKKGYTSCGAIPATVSISYQVESANYSFDISPGTKTIPAGYTGAGATFEKRFVVKKQGVPELIFEFNCTSSLSKVGYSRTRHVSTEQTPNTTEHKEIWYDAADNGPHIFELYKYDTQPFSTWTRKYT
jgi:hypothetical protein